MYTRSFLEIRSFHSIKVCKVYEVLQSAKDAQTIQKYTLELNMIRLASYLGLGQRRNDTRVPSTSSWP